MSTISEPTSAEGGHERPPGRRRRIWAVGAVAAVAAVVFVLVWFQPQKLFIDDRVNEALPTAAPAARPPVAGFPGTEPASGSGSPTTAATAGPAVQAEGPFTGIAHGTSGRALVLDPGDGTTVLRLEELATDNGPDLFVYLSSAAISDGEQALGDDVVNLGKLKGNIGSQNYEVPADVDLERYGTVVIWCRRFAAAFGAAELT